MDLYLLAVSFVCAEVLIHAASVHPKPQCHTSNYRPRNDSQPPKIAFWNAILWTRVSQNNSKVSPMEKLMNSSVGDGVGRVTGPKFRDTETRQDV